MKDTYQAVIFDLDGTLADSIADIADSMNRVLQYAGFPTHSYEVYKGLVGNGLKNLTFVSLPEKNRDEQTVEECFALLMKEYSEHYMLKTKLYDGIPELLDLLVAEGLKLAVLSNKADVITQKICGVLLDKWKFDCILGASERFPRKPAPDSALYLASSLGVHPNRVLYLGDTGIDMRTALAAGMKPVGVTWGFRTENELRESGAHLLINHPMELPNAAMAE